MDQGCGMDKFDLARYALFAASAADDQPIPMSDAQAHHQLSERCGRAMQWIALYRDNVQGARISHGLYEQASDAIRATRDL